MKKKIFVILITLVVILPMSVNAQTLKLTDKKINNLEFSSAYHIIFNKFDNNGKVNGFIVLGEYRNTDYIYEEFALAKAYNNNNELEKTYLKEDIINEGDEPTSNNLLFFNNFYNRIDELDMSPKGDSDTAIIMFDELPQTKTTQIPEYKWKAQFGGNGHDVLFNAIKDYENNKHTGYIFIGGTTSTDLEGLHMGYIAVKYDLNGNLVWQRNIQLEGESIIPSYNNEGKIDGLISAATGTLQKINLNSILSFEKYKNKGRLYDLAYTRDKNEKVIGYTAIGDTCNNVDRRETSDIQKRIIEPRIKDTNSKENDFLPKLKNLGAEYCYPTITKYDLDGNEIDEIVMDTLPSTYFYQIKETKNIQGKYDGYIMIGDKSRNNYDSYVDGIVMELDSNLKEENKEIYKDGEYENEFNLLEEAYDMNGNFIGYNIVGTHWCNGIPMNSTNTKGTMKLLTNTSESTNVCNGFSAGLLLKYTYPKFPIIKEETKNGTIEIDEEAIAGTTVKLKIKAKTGFYADEIIVTDENGNKIEVKDNSFVMPEGKVNVRVIFKRIINPETLSTISIIVIIALLMFIGTIITIKKKKRMI